MPTLLPVLSPPPPWFVGVADAELVVEDAEEDVDVEIVDVGVEEDVELVGPTTAAISVGVPWLQQLLLSQEQQYVLLPQSAICASK